MAQEKQHLTNPIERPGGRVLSQGQRRAPPPRGLAFAAAHFHDFRQPGIVRAPRQASRASSSLRDLQDFQAGRPSA
jgi:hypothetical protein